MKDYIAKSNTFKLVVVEVLLNESIKQTKMEGGTERHLPKTDDRHHRVHR